MSCFYLLIFYFEKFSTWIWRLPFAVYVMLKLSFVPIHKNAKTATNFTSILPATFIGLLLRPDANFFFLCHAIVKSVHRNHSYYREFYVIFRSWNLKRNVGPKTKDFVTRQFYPKLTAFFRLCRSILVIFWDYKIKFISRTLSLWLHFLIGGFYSDTIAFVNDSCLRCPNGTFVPYSKAPGKSARECIACPQGRHIL